MLSAGSIFQTSTQIYMDFVEVFNILLDLSAIYFAHFRGCYASFMYSCHSILQRYNLFSGVEYNIVLFHFCTEFNLLTPFLSDHPV